MRHIYVHVPFCARRCSYCDFAIAVRRRIPARQFVAAVQTELALRRFQNEWDDDPVETLYFGGGTPSLLPPEAIAELIALLAPDSGGRPAGAEGGRPTPEITLEANPDDVSPAPAAGWVAAGVNRLSLGAQSFHPGVLRWMHRTHDAAAVPRAVDVARHAGIASLSLDLIFGLPPELGASFGGDLARAAALAPDHLSVYGLSVEPRTPLARWISRGATAPLSDRRYAREFLSAHEQLAAGGFEHYEVSNYARPGWRSRHNCAYWDHGDYAGLGPAAHSYRAGERRWNRGDWTGYERDVRAGGDPVEARERLTIAERRLERLYLGFRTDQGVERAPWWEFPAGLDARLRQRGWLTSDATSYRLTPTGWLYLDEIVSSLTTSPEGG